MLCEIHDSLPESLSAQSNKTQWAAPLYAAKVPESCMQENHASCAWDSSHHSELNGQSEAPSNAVVAAAGTRQAAWKAFQAAEPLRRIDTQTTVPSDVFHGMLKLGQKAMTRGAHRLVMTDEGRSGVLITAQ